MEKKIILASGSEARKKLLERIGIDFEIEKSDFEEIMDASLPPEKLAQELALGKARTVAAKHEDAVIIAADSFVILDGEYLGKPHSEEEARAMLHKISGKRQDFVTGIAIIDTTDGTEVSDFSLSEIWVRNIADEDIEDYIKTGEPFSKAGGYAIQEIGSIFIEKVHGSHTGIVGLPMDKIYDILKNMGVRMIR